MSTTNVSDVLSQYQTTQQTTSSTGSRELGQNEFMELMLAQMKYQNPLEPQDNGEFISQLAQFSSLEEMQELSDTVEDVVTQFRSTQALQASAMVGKRVLAPSGVGVLGADGEIRGSVEVPASTSGVVLSVYSASGELVRQMELGSAEAGSLPFVWDGKDGNGVAMPEGTYEIVAQATYSGGSEQLTTLISANVDSVSLGQGGSITLNLAGMGSVALSDVQQVQ